MNLYLLDDQLTGLVFTDPLLFGADRLDMLVLVSEIKKQGEKRW